MEQQKTVDISGNDSHGINLQYKIPQIFIVLLGYSARSQQLVFLLQSLLKTNIINTQQRPGCQQQPKTMHTILLTKYQCLCILYAAIQLASLSSLTPNCIISNISTLKGYGQEKMMGIHHIHHIRFWYLWCYGCPGLRGRQHLATPHTRSP